MKVIFDTNVIIAGMLEEHVHHQRALPWLEKALNAELEYYISSQTLPELYSTLTRNDLIPRLSPVEARKMIGDNVEQYAQVITLTSDEYYKVLDRMERLNRVGFKVYDCIITQAAIKVNVDQLLTFNFDDFKKVWPEGLSKISVP